MSDKPDYKNAIADYTLKWKLTDLFLRDLCSNKYHLHIKEDIVKAKMIIIARSFSSGIERQIRIRKKIKNRRQGEAMDILTTLFYTNGEDVDNIISSINECNTFNEKAIYQIYVKATQSSAIFSKKSLAHQKMVRNIYQFLLLPNIFIFIAPLFQFMILPTAQYGI